jgi:hypothetical protein
VGLWNFENDMLDSSGNSFDLTVQAGTERYALANGLKGFRFDGSTTIQHNVTETALQIVGDITAEMLVRYYTYSLASRERLIRYGAAGDLENANILYSLETNTDATKLNYFCEYDAGVDVEYEVDVGIWIEELMHVVVVRDSNKITFYINGEQQGATSTTLTAPTGSSLGIFTVGENQEFEGIVCCVKILDTALTAEQVYDEYKRTWARIQ